MKKLTVIQHTGFDGGGATTLVENLNKLDNVFVFVKNAIYENGEYIPDIQTYDTDEELISKIPMDTDEILCIQMKGFDSKKTEKSLQLLKKLREHFQKSTITKLIICRTVQSIQKEIKLYQEYIPDFQYDIAYCISQATADKIEESKLAKHTEILDFNIYNFDNEKQYNENRTNHIGILGRLCACKGTFRLMENIDKILDKNNHQYAYSIFGANYNLSKTGKPSAQMSIVNALVTDIKTKEIKPELALRNSYDEQPVMNQLNVYKSYQKEAFQELFSNLKYAICPTLGIEQYDKRDERYLKQSTKNWITALEYVNLELVDNYIPVFFSEQYMSIFPELMIPELTYHKFSDIPDMIEHIDKHCDHRSLALLQREKFIQHQKEVNQNLLKVLCELEYKRRLE